ncbi:Hypothetical predicted protein [Olea europaea subsp. europaea]|uniref:TF-B3 domain-containing protein n=1 Tax=Olea europaea subsp. europaea TaxID=158383 RepID=A0A8S0V1Q2_OLEEU|nr:Hypothetical predicted protein [Olea europaea subsp. europaea]
MLPNAVNLPCGDEFSPDSLPSSSSSGTIKIFGVSIAPFNNQEEEDTLKEHNLEINLKDYAETSHKRKLTEFHDYLSSMNCRESSRVEESNSDENPIDLELRLGSSITKRRRIMVQERNAIESSDYLSSENYTTKSETSFRVEESNSDQTLLELGLESIIMRSTIRGSEIVQQFEVQREDPIIMGAEIIEQVQVVQHEDPIIMGAEIIEQVQVQDEDHVIINAEIIQQVQFQPEDPNHWTIRKVLKKSDVDGSSRLLIGRKEVLSHIAPFFTDNPFEFCQNNAGIRVIVYDVDTNTGHMLKLTKWKTGSFVLKNNWTQQFVKRRELKENDAIGLRMDFQEARLEFTVLRRHATEV